MDTQLQYLIDKIKTEGVQEAEASVAKIIHNAEEQAMLIIQTANDKAALIEHESKIKLDKLNAVGQQALIQAGREVELKLRERLEYIFKSILASKVEQELSPELLKSILLKLSGSLDTLSSTELEMLLSETDLKALTSLLMKEFKNLANAGLHLKVSDKLEHGFRIGQKGSKFYYDFSAEAITEALWYYLNPRIRDLYKS